MNAIENIRSRLYKLYRYVSDTLGAECDASVPESIRDEEEEIVEERKDEGKLGFCEIQWQQQAAIIDGRKFTKKNFKRLDDVTMTKLSLSMTKIDEEQNNDRVEIIPLTSPMKVRSPSVSYRPCYSIPAETPIESNFPSKIAQPVHLSVPNIKTISHPPPQRTPEHSSYENLRKTSLMSLKSLSMSLRLLRNRARSDSLENVESTTLETIDETRKSIFKLDNFEKNLKKFVTKSNEADFQTYSDYMQDKQQNSKTKPKTSFKNQKVFARRSSMSDIHEENPNPKTLQQHSHISTSSTNVKHDKHEKHDKHDRHDKHEKTEKQRQKEKADKTAEMLKEVRKRNLETAKRITAPRRISTAY